MDIRIEQIPADMLVGYRRVGFQGEPYRIGLYGEDLSSNHPYHRDFPGLLGFLDYFDGAQASLGYISVDPKAQNNGYARQLIDELYSRTGDRRVYWGKIMDDAIAHLKKEYRDKFPEKTAAAPKVLYHISPPFNRESILQHGLDFSKSDPRGRLEGHDENWPGGNYLFPSYDAADMSSEDDIYEVNVQGLNVLPDPYEGLDNKEWYTPDPIPPDRIKLVRPSALPEDYSPWWERSSNIFDPIQKTLDQKVFTGITPKPTTLNFIHNHLQKVLQRAFGFDALQYIDLYLTGSLTTYQWDESSDCDVSLFVQWDQWPTGESPNEIRKTLVLIMIDKTDGIYLPGTEHPIQHFVVPPETMPEDLYKPGLRSAFDFQANKWVVPPEKDRVHDITTELPILYHRAQDMAAKMEIALDYDTYYAKDLWHQIHRKRTLDQRKGLGDFSEGNIVYKYLLHNGYFDRIREELGEYIAKVANGNPAFSLGQATAVMAFDPEKRAEAEQVYEAWKVNEQFVQGWNGAMAWAGHPQMPPETKQMYREEFDSLRQALGKTSADTMRWDSLDDVPTGGEMGFGGDSGHWEPDHSQKEEQTESLKVIYDFNRDTILLGDRKKAAELPEAQIVGEYSDGVVTLHDIDNHWLNAKYFKELWEYSFPERPYRSLRLESDRGTEHIHGDTVSEHGTSTQEPITQQARVSVEEERPQDGQEEPQGSQVLPLDSYVVSAWKQAMPEQFGSFEWPTVEEIQEAGQHAVEETGQIHPGWYPHAEGALDAARGAAINRHVGLFGSGGTDDPFELAGHLIWRIQDTQAAIDGNKRTGAVTGLSWLDQHGIEVNLPEDDSFFRVVDSASQMEPESGAQAIAEYLRSYAVTNG